MCFGTMMRSQGNCFPATYLVEHLVISKDTLTFKKRKKLLIFSNQQKRHRKNDDLLTENCK